MSKPWILWFLLVFSIAVPKNTQLLCSLDHLSVPKSDNWFQLFWNGSWDTYKEVWPCSIVFSPDLSRKVLLSNCAKFNSVEYPHEHRTRNLPRRAQSMRVAPLLRVMGVDHGSSTPSPRSTPSPSSEEDEEPIPAQRTRQRGRFGCLVSEAHLDDVTLYSGI